MNRLEPLHYRWGKQKQDCICLYIIRPKKEKAMINCYFETIKEAKIFIRNNQQYYRGMKFLAFSDGKEVSI